MDEGMEPLMPLAGSDLGRGDKQQSETGQSANQEQTKSKEKLVTACTTLEL